MALLHHWKFNGNLQDAVGDLHLTNVVGTPAYTSNKDGVANSCLDNSASWYASSNSTLECGDSQRSYSFWIKKDSDVNTHMGIYQDRMFFIEKEAKNISLKYRANSSWATYPVLADNGVFDGASSGIWINICFTINNNGVKKMFINGILKSIIINTIAPTDSIDYSSVFINAFRIASTIFSYPSVKDIDEFKYFDHILTDGGLTAIGQVASVDSEVWQLYISGVNNMPPYILNPATDITGTSARLTWSES